MRPFPLVLELNPLDCDYIVIPAPLGNYLPELLPHEKRELLDRCAERQASSYMRFSEPHQWMQNSGTRTEFAAGYDWVDVCDEGEEGLLYFWPHERVSDPERCMSNMSSFLFPLF